MPAVTARRAFGIAAIAAGALVVGSASPILWWLRAMLPTTAGVVTLAGLTADVTVIREGTGVPHIFAGSEIDAVRALGFVQAQDRRYAMALVRAVATGRLAELVGDVPASIDVAGVLASGSIEVDRQMRTLGLGRLAEAEVALLAPENRALLEAYAAGVNAATERAGAGGFARALGMPLAAWTPADSLAVLKLGALLYANQRWEELRAAGLVAELGPDALADFVPPYPGDSARRADDRRGGGGVSRRPDPDVRRDRRRHDRRPHDELRRGSRRHRDRRTRGAHAGRAVGHAGNRWAPAIRRLSRACDRSHRIPLRRLRRVLHDQLRAPVALRACLAGAWGRGRAGYAGCAPTPRAAVTPSWDASTSLDAGDSAELGDQYARLREHLPALTVVGGCCGTDHRHVEAIGRAVSRVA